MIINEDNVIIIIIIIIIIITKTAGWIHLFSTV